MWLGARVGTEVLLIYLEKQKKMYVMVVARSTLCFQSSLKTLARAPRAASVNIQTHINEDTQTQTEADTEKVRQEE